MIFSCLGDLNIELISTKHAVEILVCANVWLVLGIGLSLKTIGKHTETGKHTEIDKHTET